jgi:hypothetical protein
MGFVVYGHPDSPVVPLMVFVVAKIQTLIVGLLERNVATVGVGFPATKMTQGSILQNFISAENFWNNFLSQSFGKINQRNVQ